MGLCNSPDIFQEKMSELFVSLDIILLYIDDLLHVTKGSWTENITALKEIFPASRRLGSRSTPSSRALAIQALAVPKTRKQLRQFIGMINFYNYMWQKRSQFLDPLTAVTSKNVKYE